ncbi:hypothetical protein AALO_G00204970 [Alosa alosa]|uniref:Uncharacterized protein n=1 Tax=Alosa alosa TaxID=278164 RepID=A0AAV6G500_9TELE|nr:hypothetical protein AALO_G00204970 [Alosa alosa]
MAAKPCSCPPLVLGCVVTQSVLPPRKKKSSGSLRKKRRRRKTRGHDLEWIRISDFVVKLGVSRPHLAWSSAQYVDGGERGRPTDRKLILFGELKRF